MPTPPIPGLPHPDVAIIRHVFSGMNPGDVIRYLDVAKSIQMSPNDPAFRRRCDSARRQLEKENIVISCVPSTGFLRELPSHTKERVEGRETRTIRRRARRNVRQLESINPTDLPESERPELYALRVINRTVEMATTKPAHIRLTAAATAISAEITVTKALEVLQNRNGVN